MTVETSTSLILFVYSLSPKIDAPKIDAFSKNSRNFQNLKFFWWALSKSPRQRLTRQRLTRQRLTHFQVLSTIKMRQSLAKDCMSDPRDVNYNNLYIANVKFASVIIEMASWRTCIIFKSRIPISCQSITSLKGRFYNNFFIVDFFRFRCLLFIWKRIGNGKLLLSQN